MIMTVHIAAWLAVFSAIARANRYGVLPEPTQSALAELDPLGWTPVPTSIALLPEHGLLRKRQSPGEVCGYINGTILDDNAWDCGARSTCGFDYSSELFGCCASIYTISSTSLPLGCDFYTTCYDSTVSCDSACQSDKSIYLCTQSDYPYCEIYRLFSGVNTFTNFGCANTSYGALEFYPNTAGTTTVESKVAITNSSGTFTQTSTYYAVAPTSVPSVVPFTETQATRPGGVATVTVTADAGSKVGSLNEKFWHIAFVMGLATFVLMQ